ncbi:MAG: TonB-dependent receptor [Pseudomonadota bacterium]|nr:TonB-dependent receptor [Pseudomonadota bacterium]
MQQWTACRLFKLTLLAMYCSGVAYAGGPPQPTAILPTITVSANAVPTSQLQIADTASQGTVDQQQLANRPLLRPAEVLETVPGVIATQHSGDGKANQYFLRGFNLDHGTDFAVSVDGVPINLPTHGHGQSYLDMNFIIPELVERIDYRKGVYAAQDGDFASAGQAEIRTVRELERPFVQITIGENAYQRTLAAGSVALNDQASLLGAMSLTRHDGVWEMPQKLEADQAVLRYTEGDPQQHWTILAQYYQAKWQATDQVAQRAIDQGVIGRFGNLESSNGGDTQRSSLSLNRVWHNAQQSQILNLYALDYQLNLFSNFTYFLGDPLRGDQFEQVDRRQVLGGNLKQTWRSNWQERAMSNSLGIQLRHDHIRDVGLHLTERRERFDTVRQDQVNQTSLGGWAENQVQWLPWLRSVAGLRVDAYRFDVQANRPENSGRAYDQIVSPKFGVVLGPWAKTEYYLSAGRGFHSNDARGSTIKINPDPREAEFLQTIDRVDPLVRTRGAELGLRTEWLPNLHSSMAIWHLKSDSELLFVGDAGTTEASRPSERYGLEMSHFYQPNAVWTVDLDAAWSHGRFSNDALEGNRISGAMEKTASLGLTYQPYEDWDIGLRGRYFGSRPLIEDNSKRATASTLLNAQVTYRPHPDWQARLEVFNLLDRKVNDIEYFYASCLPSELSTPICAANANEREGVEDRHVHPAEPRSLRLSVRLSF